MACVHRQPPRSHIASDVGSGVCRAVPVTHPQRECRGSSRIHPRKVSTTFVVVVLVVVVLNVPVLVLVVLVLVLCIAW